MPARTPPTWPTSPWLRATGYGQRATGNGHFMRSEGPDCHRRWKPGTPVVALLIVRHGGQPLFVGLMTAAPGAYTEQVVVRESMTMPVPNGLSAEHAALTEPMAVAWHAVRRGAARGRPRSSSAAGRSVRR
ncbi:hypothetical protein [Nocardia sp. R7R-8]|uniref:hypothetical protein n=1 Tax=Nocardia sp. R7R-8 TaxID=3459304 RepID=UPI00403DE96C